jgi:tryptophanyl-tRNA synthetase
VEYSRDIAQKFNNVFNTETFNLPEPLIMKGVEIISGTDGQKMSKSYNNTIPLFATREEITKAVMGIVTDSSGDVPVNVYNIHKLIKSETELKEIYDKNKGKYKILKETLIEDLDTMIKPLRKRRAELEKNTEEIKAILADGAIKAKTKANAKLLTIKKNIGVL